jgi:hypothetical protein
VTTNDSSGDDRTVPAPRILYYEPKHDESEMHRITLALESRGYQVTTEDTAGAVAWVFVSMDGERLMVDLGSRCADLPDLEEWSSTTAYVSGIVDYIAGIAPGAGIVPGAKVIYYGPTHNDETARLVRETLARRGYTLAHPVMRDFDAVDLDAAPDLSVDVDPDGSLLIMYGDGGSPLSPVDAYLTPESYALAMAAWFDSDHTGVPELPEEEQAAVAARAERAAHIAGMRAYLDLAEADPTLPLPRNAGGVALGFTVSEFHADRLAAHLSDVQEIARPGQVYDHIVTGEFKGVPVFVEFSCSRTGVRV